MRWGLAIAASLLVVVGLLLIAYLPLLGQTIDIPVFPSGETYTPNGFGPMAVRVSWSGAAPGTLVALESCTDSTCQHVHNVTRGTGSSGTLTASVTGGQTYVLTTITTGGAVSAKVTTIGLTYTTIAGIVLLVAGAASLVAARSRGRRPPPTPPAPPPSDR